MTSSPPERTEELLKANDPDRFRKPAPVIELTPEVLAELQHLLDDAQKIASVTGLPWRSEPSGGKPVLCANKETKGCCIAYGTIGSWKQIDLAVAAVNALPALLARIEALHAEREKLRGLLARVTDAAENLAGELTDPGTEALSAIYCARAALSGIAQGQS